MINKIPVSENKSIAITITEGRVIRDLFCNGFLEMARDAGLSLLVVTPAARVPAFVSEWSRPWVQFHPLRPYQLGVTEQRALGVRKRMIRLGRAALVRWLAIEPRFFPLDPEYIDLLKDCRAVVITHPLHHTEMPVFRAAVERGLPTLGVMRSWDNLYKGLRIYAQRLAVWNEINRDEACTMIGYSPEQIHVIGGSQFDPYFAPDSVWSRLKLAQMFDLDPGRPILTLATLGSFLHLYDETYLVDLLLEAIEKGQIPGRPQLVIRLHPGSKLEYFHKYLNAPDVRLSYISGYIPSLGWTMSRQEVVEVANLLRHSDVVVSPGSTITIETAIFDTPTLVPIFHTYQPELGKQMYGFHLSSHFKRLADLDLVPILRQPEELVPAVNHALADRSWYRDQRLQLVSDYIQYTDGCSTQRLVDLLV